MLPPADADAVIVRTSIEKYAAMVWFAVTPVKSYPATAPWFAPSTSTLSIWYPVFGEIVNDWFAPWVTFTAPDGVIDPPAEAVAVIV